MDSGEGGSAGAAVEQNAHSEHLINMLKYVFLVGAMMLVGSCDGNAQVSNVAVPPVVAPSEVETKAQDVSVCDLKNDPAKYNHAVVVLEVEGLKLPLIDDEKFKAYDKLFGGGKNKVKATVVGTFFSGKKQQRGEGKPVFYGGYGHMGIGSIFIVQQVLSSEKSDVKNLFEFE